MTADDTRLRQLAALARKMPHSESARRDAASFERFEQRLEARGRSHWVRQHWARIALGTTVFAAAAVLLVARAPRDLDAELPLQVARQTDATGVVGAAVGGVTSEPERGERLAFSDGSQVTLAAHAVAEVTELSAHGARVRLARGAAEVAIQKRKHAAWQFQAGPYTVRVTGTAFKLSWSDELQQLEVGMHHGSVIVSGPLAPVGVALRGGQRLVASERAHRLLVEDWAPELQAANAVATVAPAHDEPEAAQAQRAERPSQRDRARAHSNVSARGAARIEADAPASPQDWAKRVAQGDFEGVLREAKALGHARVLASAQVSDLTALADAARYARKTLLGRDALMALRARFPSSEMGRDSAFFLGRLSSGEAALSWYDRYQREQPDGTYVSQALGRSMMLRYEQGANEHAAQLAQAYLARFPAGPYAASAHKLTAPARVTTPAP